MARSVPFTFFPPKQNIFHAAYLFLLTQAFILSDHIQVRP